MVSTHQLTGRGTHLHSHSSEAINRLSILGGDDDDDDGDGDGDGGGGSRGLNQSSTIITACWALSTHRTTHSLVWHHYSLFIHIFRDQNDPEPSEHFATNKWPPTGEETRCEEKPSLRSTLSFALDTATESRLNYKLICSHCNLFNPYVLRAHQQLLPQHYHNIAKT